VGALKISDHHQEAGRILPESIDDARQGQLALRGVAVPGPMTTATIPQNK
jgi:hypothetical protein